MFKQEILISSVKQARAFVNMAGKYPNLHIYLRNGNYKMDGHSIMGVISLDMELPIILETADENLPQEFLEDVKSFAIN